MAASPERTSIRRSRPRGCRQYTETGTVDGITVNVDRERFNGTADELTAWWTGAS
jgi:GH25 family lysozyme M1 (1,4-beta-N-acetylmuramidase)